MNHLRYLWGGINLTFFGDFLTEQTSHCKNQGTKNSNPKVFKVLNKFSNFNGEDEPACHGLSKFRSQFETLNTESESQTLRYPSLNYGPGIVILSWPGFIKTLAYKPNTPAMDNAMIIIAIKLKLRLADIRNGWKPLSGCHLKTIHFESKFDFTGSQSEVLSTSSWMRPINARV